MEKFILTSNAFTGQILFGYDEETLVYFVNESDMSSEGIRWLFRNFPFTTADLDVVKKAIKGKLEPVTEEVTFEAFWEEYGKKVNRLRCEKYWPKMSEAKQIKAIKSIKSYNNFLIRHPGRARLDPENYLKRESYLNDWNSI